MNNEFPFSTANLAFHAAVIKSPEMSEWNCHLFGSDGSGLSWRPLKGKHPNWFWRWMQFLILGNRWVKDEATRPGGVRDETRTGYPMGA